MSLLPPFNEDGCLPRGEYPLTFAELRDSMLVLGPGEPSVYPNWDASWRERLVDRAESLTKELWIVGVTKVFINGSFVEDKDHPNDIDGYFECAFDDLASGRLQQRLNQVNPLKIWTWEPESRRPCLGSVKRQLPMWHQYRVEFYPHALGIMSGITDEWGNDLEFPAAFRRSRRDGKPKGIIHVLPE